MKNITITEKI